MINILNRNNLLEHSLITKVMSDIYCDWHTGPFYVKVTTRTHSLICSWKAACRLLAIPRVWPSVPSTSSPPFPLSPSPPLCFHPRALWDMARPGLPSTVWPSRLAHWVRLRVSALTGFLFVCVVLLQSWTWTHVPASASVGGYLIWKTCVVHDTINKCQIKGNTVIPSNSSTHLKINLYSIICFQNLLTWPVIKLSYFDEFSH